ncbi:MAG: mechanosensitive ion channel family protein [Anaerolineales bacterium]|nr:mechanosensitive ion channel family protein [Anaerolineales bacterium]
MESYLSNLLDLGLKALPNLLLALFIFFLSLYLARALSRLLKRVLLTRQTASNVTHLLADILKWTIIILGCLSALQRFFDVTAFIAGLGILGVIVGFALQNILQNFVSGIILLVQQPFTVGDDVQLLEIDGLALQINIRTTELQAKDGRIVILPNAEVIARPIVNYTRANRRRVDLTLQMAEPAEAEKIRQTVHAELREIVGFVQAPAPEALFQNLTQNSVELRVSFWVDISSVSVGVAKDQALIKIQQAFKRHKIKLAPPPLYVEVAK